MEMTIDLDAPEQRQYTGEEKSEIRFRFLITLHTLLLVYLSLHNFLIPFVGNWAKGISFFTDVHFWFLFHFPMNYLLRKKKTIWAGYFYFLVLGSLARVGTESLVVSQFKSWGIFSVYLSEISAAIFYFVIYPLVNNKKYLLFCLAGLLIAPALTAIEKRSSWSKADIDFSREKILRNYSKLGCQGSENQFTLPIIENISKENIHIVSCGFKQKEVFYHQDLKIINDVPEKTNLRLYRSSYHQGVIRWKFMKLIQLNPGDQYLLDLSSKEMFYLLKSPEKVSLGHLVIAVSGDKNLKGRVHMNYDSIFYER